MSTSFHPQRFGPYTLLRPVGRGGMAEVFLAQTRGLGGFERLLCVKRVLDEHVEDGELIELLVEEAKLVSRIAHPNVAQVFDLGKVDEQFYIAMEWIDGVDALKLLEACEQREIHVPVSAAAYIVHEIARGLHAAHTTTDEEGRPLGIVHRDVTPTNVLLSLEGQVKLIDFGVARNVLRSRQTAVGVVKGKYNYLAPEQARGERVDARADVFAAGILLFELLVGEPLYPGTKAADVVVKARNAKIPSIKKLRGDVPDELEQIARRALEKDPAKRTPSAAALADELERFLTTHAPEFGAGSLAALVLHLFPERAAAAVDGETMDVADFVASGEVSLVTAPGVLVRSGDWDLDESPTRVATVDEIHSRRAQRAAGAQLAPVPPLPPRPKKRPSRDSEPPPGPSSRPPPPPPGAASKGASSSGAGSGGAGSSGAGASASRGLVVAGGVLVVLLVAGLAVLLWPRVATLRVESIPPGARVLLDGVDTTQRSPATLEVARGPHTLSIQLDGYLPYETHVEADDELTLSVPLESARASLEVSSVPPGAMVRRDGLFLGFTPYTLDGLALDADVTLELAADGYAPLRYAYRPPSGGAQRIELRLVPLDPGTTP